MPRRASTRSVTVTAIVLTANHYVLDAVGGFAVLGIGYLIARPFTRAGQGPRRAADADPRRRARYCMRPRPRRARDARRRRRPRHPRRRARRHRAASAATASASGRMQVRLGDATDRHERRAARALGRRAERLPRAVPRPARCRAPPPHVQGRRPRRRRSTRPRPPGFSPSNVDLSDPDWKEAFLQPAGSARHGRAARGGPRLPRNAAEQIARRREHGAQRPSPRGGPTRRRAPSGRRCLRRVVIRTPSLPAARRLLRRRCSTARSRRRGWSSGWVELAWPSGRPRVDRLEADVASTAAATDRAAPAFAGRARHVDSYVARA